MLDTGDDDLFGGDFEDAVEPSAYDQDGPDLFGLTADEVIVAHDPVGPIAVDIDEDEMDEIPIDPDDPAAGTGAEASEESAESPDEDETDSEPTTVLKLPAAEPRRPPSERADAPLALYRRYRPDSFADVIGQDHVTEPLQRALVNNRVNHAYLFSGPRGCGKTTSARILARCLNCEEGPTPEPCGVCQSCRDLARGGTGSIDVIEIDAASHGGVDDARDLRERAFFAPVASRYKIYIVDEAHMVTKEGFNALLKLVEEPPPHVKFIFATTEPEKVLGTIRSRTHHYPFRLVPPKVLSAYLETLCQAEGVAVDKTVLPLVVRAGAGSVRDSLSVLDQLLGGAGPAGVSYRQATALLGYTPDTLLDEIMDAFAAGDSAGVFAAVDRVIEVGQDPRRFAEDLLRRLRDLIIVAAVPDALTTGLVDVSGDQAERLTVQAQGMGAGELTRAAEVIAKGLTDMRGTTAPRLHLELMCARVLLPGADVDARGVHARLDRLERRLQMVADGHAAPAAGAVYAAPATGDGAPSGVDDRYVPPPDPTRPASSGPSELNAPPPDPTRPASPGPSEARVPEPPRQAVGAQPSEPASPRPQNSPQPDQADPTQQPKRPEPPSGADPAALTTADVRRMWPQVLEAVKGRRKVTWIVLSQNAQVHSYGEGVLTLAMNSGGVRESFGRGGSPDILRESLIEVLGIAPTIEAIVSGGDPVPGPTSRAGGPSGQPAGSPSGQPAGDRDPGRQPAGDPVPGRHPADPEQAGRHQADPGQAGRHPADPGRPSAPARGAAPSALSPEPPPDDDEERPNFAALAKENIRPTQVTPPTPEADEEHNRDDVDLDGENTGVDDLLMKELGAELISENPNQP